MDILTFVLIVLTTSIAYWYKKYSDIERASAHIPGTKPLPFVGHGHLFINKSSSAIFNASVEIFKVKRDVCRCLLGTHLQVLIGKPEMVDEFLTSNEFFDKSIEYCSLKNWFGNGLTTCGADKWHPLRKMVTPAFHFQILEQFVQIFDVHAQDFVEQLKVYNNQTIDVHPILSSFTLESIMESAMGVKLSTQSDFGAAYHEAVKE